MRIYEPYLKKHAVPDYLITGWQRDISIIIVIPCYDEPELQKTLDSLLNCDKPNTHIEVIILINSGEQASPEIIEQNQRTYNFVLSTYPFNSSLELNIKPWLIEGVRKKHAGVGYARKLGMDMAVSTFNGIQSKNGLIVSLDADTLVEPNYLKELYRVYSESEIGGGTIRFEHPVTRSSDPENMAIMLYELHLRYYHNALKQIGFPYHFYTIGSAFYIRAAEYVKHGGMNRKKGGEDFYFLHKALPHITHQTLQKTTVVPSSRISDRVPFGTGPKIRHYLESHTMQTYEWLSFEDLSVFFGLCDTFYTADSAELKQLLKGLKEPLSLFLNDFEAEKKLVELKRNTSNSANFKKRFFDLFNGFFIVKYLNQSHLNHYHYRDVSEQAKEFSQRYFNHSFRESYDLLMFFRQTDQKTS